ncbi:hypothetical protein [Methanogenium sp. MK-MG]|uniref:hypothetical protein n=1 Tax=Methanogenium sp. MK-MG TaxID=2599926 RepID=UPI001C201DA7|nr:hypothetical protein [Methanogenium sp. MK-MG]KAF1078470.1 hypothetical protein MKMG_00621 [Methanogenium sp. MK-MG]
MSRRLDLSLILAEEILTSEGEIIGLFLNEEVLANLRYRKVHSSLHRISRLIRAERMTGGWNPARVMAH